MGTIVRIGDPNYALFSKATQTIQRFLSTVGSNELMPVSEIQSGLSPNHAEDDWALQLDPDMWNLDSELWENLSGHPFLLNTHSSF